MGAVRVNIDAVRIVVVSVLGILGVHCFRHSLRHFPRSFLGPDRDRRSRGREEDFALFDYEDIFLHLSGQGATSRSLSEADWGIGGGFIGCGLDVVGSGDCVLSSGSAFLFRRTRWEIRSSRWQRWDVSEVSVAKRSDRHEAKAVHSRASTGGLPLLALNCRWVLAEPGPLSAR